MAGQKQKMKANRATRTRKKIARFSNDRPRLSVFRSSKNIAAQVIDDREGKTLASASSLDADLRKDLAKGGDQAAAAKIGQLVAERALKAGVTDVVFDRGGYMYHGRVKALAEAARDAGLKF
ncbi:MAG: 50S ribosomal protein L18 [Pseudomonadota bacterium]